MRGEALGLSGDLPLGRAQVQRALGLAREQEDRLAEVEALRISGNLECEARSFERAEQLEREALAVATTLAHPWTVATVQRDLGELYRRAGRSSEAVRAFEAAAAVYEQLGAQSRAERVRARATSS
jgi:tetratricopeptide (TPR) repeat protein